jgi:thioredoxin reductase (NADPH)
MLTTEVENYPGFPEGITGPDMMQRFQAQAERFGTQVKGVDVVKCDFSSRPFKLECSDGETVLADSVILATGAIANWVGLENELRLATTGGGVSACAVCDGALPVFRDKPLAVIGGGDSAMEEASYLTKFASEVHVIHRRDSFRASKTMQARVLGAENATVHWNKQLVDVHGDQFITGVELEDTVTGERSTLDVNGLFVAIGHTPATGFLDGAGIELDDAGYVVLNSRSSATNIEGVFAAGDVADATYRQAITASGMGCQAALDAEHWLASQA